MPAALLAAVLSVFAAQSQSQGVRLNGSGVPPAVHAPLPPAPTAVLGVYVPGRPAYRAVENFAAAAGAKPDLAGYVTGWGEPFAASFSRTLYKHAVIPLVQIEPAGVSVAAIAAGDDDGYLRAYADSVRKFAHPVIIGFGHEMNATWYAWGYTHTLASTFVAAWRHIVTLFRSQGAENVTWLWTIQADQPGTGPIQSWWPGASYVTWVGVDGFYTKPSDTFSSVFVPTIDQVRTFTGKPILLSQTAVGRHDNQISNILDLFGGMARYKTLGLVWFDKNLINQAAEPPWARQDWRIEDNAQAERAFQAGVHGLTLMFTGPQ